MEMRWNHHLSSSQTAVLTIQIHIYCIWLNDSSVTADKQHQISTCTCINCTFFDDRGKKDQADFCTKKKNATLPFICRPIRVHMMLGKHSEIPGSYSTLLMIQKTDVSLWETWRDPPLLWGDETGGENQVKMSWLADWTAAGSAPGTRWRESQYWDKGKP